MGHFELFLAYFCENSWILSVLWKDFVGSGPSSIKILATPLGQTATKNKGETYIGKM